MPPRSNRRSQRPPHEPRSSARSTADGSAGTGGRGGSDDGSVAVPPARWVMGYYAGYQASLLLASGSQDVLETVDQVMALIQGAKTAGA